MDNNYFRGDQLAYDVYKKKYKYGDENPQDTVDRLVRELANAELLYLDEVKNVDEHQLSPYGQEKIRHYKQCIKDNTFSDTLCEELHNYLDGFNKLLLGGSIISTLGTDQKLSLSNCFVIESPKDSLCGINATINEMENIFSHRGGVGLDLSTIRPAGTPIHNAARYSDGVVSLMKHKFGESAKYIAQNGRRGALMIMYDSRGCDLLEFIRCKQDDVSITTANISVKMHDDFIAAAEKNEDYILRFPIDARIQDFAPTIIENTEYNTLKSFIIDDEEVWVKKVKAKEVWDELVKCAWNKAEPGILFWDRIENYDPSSIYEDLKPRATNPCGEQPLAPYDTCRLMSFNLSSLVKNPYEKNATIDLKEVYKTFYDIQYYGDDIVDLECKYIGKILDSVGYSEESKPIMKMWANVIRVANKGRRTGVGFTGLGDLYAMMGVKYGDDLLTEHLFNAIFMAEMDATIDLAIIRGKFKCESQETNDWYKMLKDRFPVQYVRMKMFGRRNVSFNTCAPTGTISLLAQCSSGIEPVFMPFYKRKVKVENSSDRYDVMDASGCKFKVYFVIHEGLKQWLKVAHPDVDIDNITEVDLNTYYKESPYYNNCAQDLDWRDRVKLQAHIQKYITSSISSTVNLDKGVTVKEVDELMKLAHQEGCKGITIYRDGCRDGVMSSNSTNFNQSQSDYMDAPKRPKTLDCDVIKFSNNNEKWIAFVGVYDNKPYEIFTGLLSKLDIPGYVDKGSITKVKDAQGSTYNFEYYDKNNQKCVINSINRIFNPIFWNYGKLLSALLRHRMPPVYVIKTLQGMTFDNETINSWRNGVVRSLKKWIKDGESMGDKCPECGEKLVFENGCKKCPSCGYSACG